MHQRIDNALRALRQDLPSHLDASTIQAACRDLGHTWRKCLLTPVAIIHCEFRGRSASSGDTALNSCRVQSNVAEPCHRSNAPRGRQSRWSGSS
jgi:hypothetical protein